MYALANRTVSILRGTTLDAYGDDSDAGTVATSGVPASIVEITQRGVSVPGADRVQTVRVLVCRMPAGTSVKLGDRLLDEQSGARFAVESFANPQPLVNNGDVRVNLTRIEITA